LVDLALTVCYTKRVMKNTNIVSQVKHALNYSVDSVGRNKLGQIVLRKGFFYRMGMDSQKLAEQVQAKLDAAGVKLKVVDRGEQWRPFRGGASVAQGSHWYVILEAR